MALRTALFLVALVLASCGSGAAADVASACDRFAAPSGGDRAAGTEGQPFRTVQRLADALRPGQTGCLRTGVYDQMTDGGYVLKFFHGGRRGARLTIRSAPGERATLRGVVYFPREAPNVTLRDVDINGRVRWLHDDTVTVQVMGRGVRFEGNRVTNEHLKSCMIMGSNSGWGRAIGAVVRHNEFTGCGNPRNGRLDHNIYVENALRSTIANNVFRGAPGYGVHLYPNAQRTRVVRNVMTDNGGGVIFAGEGRLASSNNLVADNVIQGSRSDFAISQSWGPTVGHGNVARDNCISGRGVTDRTIGFVSRGNTVRGADGCSSFVSQIATAGVAVRSR